MKRFALLVGLATGLVGACSSSKDSTHSSGKGGTTGGAVGVDISVGCQ